jgi:hypothetical protein
MHDERSEKQRPCYGPEVLLHQIQATVINERVDESTPNDHKPDAAGNPTGLEEPILARRPFSTMRGNRSDLIMH